MKQCACGASISLLAKQCRRCCCRQAQARYLRTTKGRQAQARYRRGTGRIKHQHNNALRIWAGGNYHGRVESVDRARAINAHIKERLSEFIKGLQAGAHLESCASGTVRAPAADRTD